MPLKFFLGLIILLITLLGLNGLFAIQKKEWKKIKKLTIGGALIVTLTFSAYTICNTMTNLFFSFCTTYGEEGSSEPLELKNGSYVAIKEEGLLFAKKPVPVVVTKKSKKIISLEQAITVQLSGFSAHVEKRQAKLGPLKGTIYIVYLPDEKEEE